MSKNEEAIATRLFLNFFFLLYLDEDLAIECTAKALRQFLKIRRQHKITLMAVISAMHTTSLKYRSRFTSFRSHIGYGQNVRIGPDLPFSKWLEIQRTLTFEELQVLIWREVLGFETDEIANAILISEGTLKFRLNQALLDLSENKSL